jgi:hypothetical protein
MVPGTGNLERVELEAAEALDRRQDRCRLRRKRARRREKVAAHEEAARMGRGDMQVGHGADRSGSFLTDGGRNGGGVR